MSKKNKILNVIRICWACTRKQEIEVMEMTITESTRHEKYRELLNTKPVKDVIEERQLRWYGHLKQTREKKTKRYSGRPRRICQENVRAAIRNRGKEMEEVTNII